MRSLSQCTVVHPAVDIPADAESQRRCETQAGSLEIAGQIHMLVEGCNVICRKSRTDAMNADRDLKLPLKYSQFDHVTGIFVDGDTLSSEHALICVNPHAAADRLL